MIVGWNLTKEITMYYYKQRQARAKRSLCKPPTSRCSAAREFSKPYSPSLSRSSAKRRMRSWLPSDLASRGRQRLLIWVPATWLPLRSCSQWSPLPPAATTLLRCRQLQVLSRGDPGRWRTVWEIQQDQTLVAGCPRLGPLHRALPDKLLLCWSELFSIV